jgi:hypothetical protein
VDFNWNLTRTTYHMCTQFQFAKKLDLSRIFLSVTTALRLYIPINQNVLEMYFHNCLKCNMEQKMYFECVVFVLFLISWHLRCTANPTVGLHQPWLKPWIMQQVLNYLVQRVPVLICCERKIRLRFIQFILRVLDCLIHNLHQKILWFVCL